MNTQAILRRVAVLALSAAATLPVLAQEATPDTWLNIKHQKARAEVVAELARARADGSVSAWSAGYIEPIHSVQTREAVREATRRAIANGEVDAINAEVYGLRLPHGKAGGQQTAALR